MEDDFLELNDIKAIYSWNGKKRHFLLGEVDKLADEDLQTHSDPWTEDCINVQSPNVRENADFTLKLYQNYVKNFQALSQV